jgi:hypothetical protein
MPLNGRTKGAKGEQEFCDWLYAKLDLSRRPVRNLNQSRSGGGDIVCVKPYCFEVKRVEKLDLFTAWNQCFHAAKATQLMPVVAFRKNHGKWQFLLPADLLHASFNSGYIRLTEPVFTRWIRIHYAEHGSFFLEEPRAGY